MMVNQTRRNELEDFVPGRAQDLGCYSQPEMNFGLNFILIIPVGHKDSVQITAKLVSELDSTLRFRIWLTFYLHSILLLFANGIRYSFE